MLFDLLSAQIMAKTKGIVFISEMRPGPRIDASLTSFKIAPKSRTKSETRCGRRRA